MIATVDLTSPIELMPETAAEEIMQNVRMILGVWQGSVPLDREFGLDASLIDAPINTIRARLTSSLMRQIPRCEPRARFVSLTFEGDDVVRPVLTIAILEGTQ